ncbi:hypothetical protein [Ensifer sp.]|uniref:hypothetical protein n=1 Tax=Ensifer sp. TaxID=1872086 RepID=UPI002E122F94|nr:hypothetical protein [Ensifer sp.]
MYVVLAAAVISPFFLRRYFPEEFEGIRTLCWLVWCWIYVIRFRIRFWLQSVFGQTASGVLFVASAYILFEVLLAFLRLVTHQSAEHAPGEATETPQGLWGRVISSLPVLPILPFWVDVVIVVLALLVVRHHWKEWRIRGREATMPAEMAALLASSRAYLRSGRVDKKTFFDLVMETTTKILGVGRKNKTFCFSMMEVDEASGSMSVVCAYPPAFYEDVKDARLSVERSAAGASYKKQAPIYIPSTKHLAGINMSTYRCVGLIFDYSVDLDKHPSLMCIPVISEGKTRAIINVSCGGKRAFVPIDFYIVMFSAALLSYSYE